MKAGPKLFIGAVPPHSDQGGQVIFSLNCFDPFLPANFRNVRLVFSFAACEDGIPFNPPNAGRAEGTGETVSS